MVTVTYTYYLNTYKGIALTEQDFDRLIRGATADVNRWTSGRVSELPDLGSDIPMYDAIRDCICEVADKLYYFEGCNGQLVKSESLGSHSVSYSSKSSEKTGSQVIQCIVYRWLDVYGLTGLRHN